jgi:hypothetical protein
LTCHWIASTLHVTICCRRIAIPTPVNERVKKRREAMRAAGLRPVQIWVPDSRRAGFADECKRQSRLAAQADARDAALAQDMDAALADIFDGDDA